MISLKQQLSQYKVEHKALPSFNMDSFEIFQAVESAVKKTGLPCLVQLSKNEDDFVTAEKLFLLVKKSNLEGLPIYLNMDHGKDLDRLTKLVRLGFDMVHFDGSHLSFQENLDLSTDFIKTIRSINPDIVVEVEFNKINLIEKGVDPASFTSPDQAFEFMIQSGADLLASSIGNMHGVSRSLPENINLDLFKSIVDKLPDKLFTLHGGSGIPLEQVQSAIKMGIVKININTDLRLEFKRVLKESISSSTSEKVYDYLAPAISATETIIIQKLQDFSTT